MAANDAQKIVILDIAASTEQTIKNKLNEGYVIQFIVNLQPSINKLLVVYSTPEVI